MRRKSQKMRRSLATVPAAEEPPELLLSLSRPGPTPPTNCDPAEWKSGEQGNVNRVQLGFCTVFVSRQRIMQNPHPR